MHKIIHSMDILRGLQLYIFEQEDIYDQKCAGNSRRLPCRVKEWRLPLSNRCGGNREDSQHKPSSIFGMCVRIHGLKRSHKCNLEQVQMKTTRNTDVHLKSKRRILIDFLVKTHQPYTENTFTFHQDFSQFVSLKLYLAISLVCTKEVIGQATLTVFCKMDYFTEEQKFSICYVAFKLNI